jgi:uncharacterized protein
MKTFVVFLICISGLYSSARAKDCSSELSQAEVRLGYFVQSPRLIRGDGLPWDHEIQVALPPSYFSEPKKSYPVLWITDGSSRFDWAINTLWISGIEQEFIVVAIGAPHTVAMDGGEVQRRRTYDFLPEVDLAKDSPELKREIEKAGLKSNKTGGGSAFLSLLTGPLRADIRKRYRTANDNILYGSSGGGMFCVFALFEKPGGFDTYICNSPPLNYGGGIQFKAEQRYAETHSDMQAKLFLSAGDGEILQGGIITPFHVVSSTSLMAETLKLRNYPSLSLNIKIFSGEIHDPWTSTLGLRWALRKMYIADEKRDPNG